MDDAALTAEVKTQLSSEPSLKNAGIEVTTTAGVVRLSGSVSSPEQALTAVQFANSVPAWCPSRMTFRSVNGNFEYPQLISPQTVFRETLLQVRMRILGNGLTKKYVGDEQPLRAELFSAVQMEQHGKALAAATPLDPAPRTGPTAGAAERQ